MTIHQAKAFAEQIEHADKLRGMWVNARNAEHALATAVDLAIGTGHHALASEMERIRQDILASLREALSHE